MREDTPEHDRAARHTRRAVVATAAWSVPAVALSVSSPARAASQPGPLLIFSPATVRVAVGGTAAVRVALVGVVPVAGALVGILLTGGLTLATDGLRHRTFTTDGSGEIEFEVQGVADGDITAFLLPETGIRASLSVAVDPAGPGRPGERSLVVGPDVSRLVLRVQPDAATARNRENRALRHSDDQPTGRYVRTGQSIRVSAENRGAVQIAVGLYGVHAGHNDGADAGVVVVAGSDEGATLLSPRDGMVYVRHRGTTSQIAEIGGGLPVPTFVTGETDDAEFLAQLSERSGAPFVTVVSDRVFGEFQFGTVPPDVSRVAAAAAGWDAIVATTDRVYGLDLSANGVAQKSPNRIHIANPDTGAGYANATDERICFQVDTGAGADLFRLNPPELWGLWHEIGHTYQTNQYVWPGLREVTVNISSLAVQEAGGWASRLDTSGYRGLLAEFRRTPLGSRDYDSLTDVVLKVLMFDQLRRAFGEHFYPRLNQEYRVRAACGESVADLQQTFMRLASIVSGRDLERFFLEWGLTPDRTTLDTMAAYPMPEHPIWDNHDRATDRSIDSVPPYVVPRGTARTDATTLALGQTNLPAVRLSGLRNSDGSGSARLDEVAAVFSLEPRAAELVAVLVNDRGVRNALPIPVALSMGTSLEFQGLGDRTVAWLALDAAGGALRSGSTPREIHSFFADRQYFAVTVTQPDGASVTSAAVGNAHATAFAARLDGVPYSVGTTITVEHLEPARLLFWLHGTKQAASTKTTQVYRVTSSDTLVRA